jgi:hypothetical protein
VEEKLRGFPVPPAPPLRPPLRQLYTHLGITNSPL